MPPILLLNTQTCTLLELTKERVFMSENMDNMQVASKLVSQMISFVGVYEQGTIPGPVDFEYDLTQGQIDELKAAFASARAQCINALNAVTG